MSRLAESEAALRAALRHSLGPADPRLYYAYRGLGATLRAAARPAEVLAHAHAMHMHTPCAAMHTPCTCDAHAMQALLAYGPALSSYNPRDVGLAMEVAATAAAAGQPGVQEQVLRHVCAAAPAGPAGPAVPAAPAAPRRPAPPPGGCDN